MSQKEVQKRNSVQVQAPEIYTDSCGDGHHRWDCKVLIRN